MRPRSSNATPISRGAEPVGVRPAADRDQHDVGLDLRRLRPCDSSVTLHAVGRRARAAVAVVCRLERQPCFCERASAAPRPSAGPCPGTMRSRNSTTVTSAPSRGHTEPSSRPIAPPPTTSRRFGTCRQRERLGRADDALAVERQRSAARSARCRWRSGCAAPSSVCSLSPLTHDDRAGRGEARRAAAPTSILFFLKRPAMPVRAAPSTTLSLRAIIAGRSSVDAARRAMPCAAEAVARLAIELARVEQRLARDAADVQAGAAERRRPSRRRRPACRAARRGSRRRSRPARRR